MKKLLFIAALAIAQIAFAQREAKEVKTPTMAESRAMVEKSDLFKEIKENREAGKKISENPKIQTKVTRLINTSLKIHGGLSAEQAQKVIILLDVAPLEVMAAASRDILTIKDKSSTPEAKASAKLRIKLVAEASETVKSFAKDAKSEKLEVDKVKSILEISEKIAGLKLGKQSEEFIAKYEKALKEGKSVSDAIKEASGGKFTEKELRDCV